MAERNSNPVQWVYSSKNNIELTQRYDEWAKEYDKDLIRDLNTKGIFRGAKRKRLTRGTAINSPPVDVHIFDNTEWQATIEELDTDGIELDDV